MFQWTQVNRFGILLIKTHLWQPIVPSKGLRLNDGRLLASILDREAGKAVTSNQPIGTS